MLALYHLFSDVAATELAGVDAVMQKAGVAAGRQEGVCAACS